jgi:hypothetical protein
LALADLLAAKPTITGCSRATIAKVRAMEAGVGYLYIVPDGIGRPV